MKNTVKGIIIGVVSFCLLEFTTILVFAFLNNNNIVDFGGLWGIVKFIAPLLIILVVTFFLGLAIARKAILLKKISIFLR